ncbi:putative tetratricopeptide-like helical domain superfamily [Helianthus annuus]|uniref:Putative tetratricopeptide-like helical domain-containing protein n=1 Tax=Helianthus annuus TaxID=4232 RepID=A0A251VPF8_HELAN|nr:putative tetratricopeptide-like helical domain superfamily [Helianthus annuus]
MHFCVYLFVDIRSIDSLTLCFKLLLGNYGCALSDSEEAIKLSPTNVEAYYRAAKASYSVNKLVEVKAFCEKGLDQDPDNEELKKLKKQIDCQISELQQREAQVSKALKTAKDVMSAISDRGIKIGKARFQELTGLKKPILDNDHMLHCPFFFFMQRLCRVTSLRISARPICFQLISTCYSFSLIYMITKIRKKIDVNEHLISFYCGLLDNP